MYLVRSSLRVTNALLQIFICVENYEKVVDGTIIVLACKNVSVVAMDDGLKGSVLFYTASRH